MYNSITPEQLLEQYKGIGDLTIQEKLQKEFDSYNTSASCISLGSFNVATPLMSEESNYEEDFPGSENKESTSNMNNNKDKEVKIIHWTPLPSEEDKFCNDDSVITNTNAIKDDLEKQGACADEPRQMIFRVALTGGACGGKSVFLEMLREEGTSKLGVKVYCVPEAATLLTKGGLQWTDDPVATMKYQLALLRTQIALEDQFYAIAEASGKPSIIVSDRGTMDGRAFCSDEQFKSILAEGGWELEHLNNGRYDAVAHLISTACDAPEFYNFDNPSRYETPEQARESDIRLRKMYVGHPKVRVFDNSTNFEKKVERLMHFLRDVASNAFQTKRTHRLLLSAPPLESDIPDGAARVMVTTTILNHSTPDRVAMVMKRCQGVVSNHYYITVRKEGSQRIKSGHRISSRRYLSYLNQRDPHRVDIVKKSRLFVYNDLYCELCVFEKPVWANGIAIMYVENNVGRHHNLESVEMEAERDGESGIEERGDMLDKEPITDTECATFGSPTVRTYSEIIDKIPTFIKVERDITNKEFLSSFYLSISDTGREYAVSCPDDH
eukprot:Tbor_TRINITY_DN6119_c0_g1::TRINITY_DN6119_c0_g1_i8::g.22409::m.22409